MTIQTITQKTRALMITGLVAGVIGAAAVPMLPTGTVSASSNCDKVNIVYCGTTGGNTDAAIKSFQSVYASNKSGHANSPTVQKDYTDLKTIYAWAGADAATVAGMNSTNTKLGTLYKDGRIVVDGKTVATDAWVTARFTDGTGFTKIADGVWARKTTTSFANASAQVLVTMKDGKMVFAVMTECGNAVKATPKETPKTPEKPVTPTTPETPQTPETPAPEKGTPEELPQTGPASVIGLVSGVTLAGASAHQIAAKLRRKNQ